MLDFGVIRSRENNADNIDTNFSNPLWIVVGRSEGWPLPKIEFGQHSQAALFGERDVVEEVGARGAFARSRLHFDKNKRMRDLTSLSYRRDLWGDANEIQLSNPAFPVSFDEAIADFLEISRGFVLSAPTDSDMAGISRRDRAILSGFRVAASVPAHRRRFAGEQAKDRAQRSGGDEIP